MCPIFGGVSAGTDISDANAIVADVKAPDTFYAVSGAKKTGTMATVTIASGSNSYPAGYHAGDGSGLSDIEASLAVGNIKSGVNIFGVIGTLASSPPVANATVAMFQAYAAQGTFYSNPGGLNDATEIGQAIANAINQYDTVVYGQIVKIDKWRQYGHASNNGDGAWKIQYWNLSTQAWSDWVTGIVTRTAESWSDLVVQTEVTTTAIRLICTAVDSHGASYIRELEVIE